MIKPIETQADASEAQKVINAILESPNGIKEYLNRKYMNTFTFPNQEKSVGEIFAEKPLSNQLRTVWSEVSEDRLIEPADKSPFTLYKWSAPRLQILTVLGKLQAALEAFEELEEMSAQLEMFEQFLVPSEPSED